jgi:transcriptional regulator with GAF, ATPase, and Fis domain
MSRDGSAFEGVIGDLSARFAGIEPTRFDEEVAYCLRAVVEWFRTDRASFLEFSPDMATLVNAHTWARRSGIEPNPPKATWQHFPWYFDQLQQGKDVVLGNLEAELPAAAAAEREYAARVRFRAVMTLPLAVAGKIQCVISTGDFTAPREWTPIDVTRLRIVGEILANAYDRKRRDAELRAHLDEILALRDRLQTENVSLREEVRDLHDFDEIVGQSLPIRRVLARVAQVAPTDAAVLLLGETGTGKELLARALHQRSPRNGRPFVRVNCAAIPSTLIESELFGHEKGAFTGAVATRAGRFEAAHGGSLFLDEIGELGIDVQAKLLRVLQDGTFERVGSVRTLHSDVRVIAATNRDLERAMTEGRFREDLYYRLSVFPITLPPLRARREDIPLLVWSVISRRPRDLGREITDVPKRVMQSLSAYDWPGNVRELENVIERALILSRGSTLHVEELTAGASPAAAQAGSLFSLRPLDDVDRDHIRGVLERCGWRVNGAGNAAEVLGLHPNTLRFRMKKLGITRPTPADTGVSTPPGRGRAVDRSCP